MIEMPNSQMILINQESSSMDSDVLMTTTVMTTTTTAQSIKLNLTMPEDMMFNAGHQLSIIVYRFVRTLGIVVDDVTFEFTFHSQVPTLVVRDSEANLTIT